MPTKVKRRLGSIVQDLRKERGWTQAELAKQAKVSYFYVTSLESRVGVPRRLDRLEAIAKALDTSLNDILASAGLVEPQGGTEDWRAVVNSWPIASYKKRAIIDMVEKDIPGA